VGWRTGLRKSERAVPSGRGDKSHKEKRDFFGWVDKNRSESAGGTVGTDITRKKGGRGTLSREEKHPAQSVDMEGIVPSTERKTQNRNRLRVSLKRHCNKKSTVRMRKRFRPSGYTLKNRWETVDTEDSRREYSTGYLITNHPRKA